MTMTFLSTITKDHPWRRHARCLGADATGTLFYPAVEDDDGWRAKTFCMACPVLKECYAENRDDKFGIWGGTTPRDRRRITRRSITVQQIWADNVRRLQTSPVRTP